VSCSLFERDTPPVVTALAGICKDSVVIKLSRMTTIRSMTVHPSFFHTLFDYRRVFHDIAANSLSPGVVASTNVSWVDVVFTKLSEAVLVVASGFQSVSTSQDPPMSQILKRRRAEDALRASAQLPRVLYNN
jgi:hypothetical protein